MLLLGGCVTLAGLPSLGTALVPLPALHYAQHTPSPAGWHRRRLPSWGPSHSSQPPVQILLVVPSASGLHPKPLAVDVSLSTRDLGLCPLSGAIDSSGNAQLLFVCIILTVLSLLRSLLPSHSWAGASPRCGHKALSRCALDT